MEDVSENGSRVNIPIADENTNPEDPKDAFDELKSKYKEFFVIYGDDNTRCCDGEELT